MRACKCVSVVVCASRKDNHEKMLHLALHVRGQPEKKQSKDAIKSCIFLATLSRLSLALLYQPIANENW